MSSGYEGSCSLRFSSSVSSFFPFAHPEAFHHYFSGLLSDSECSGVSYRPHKCPIRFLSCNHRTRISPQCFVEAEPCQGEIPRKEATDGFKGREGNVCASGLSNGRTCRERGGTKHGEFRYGRRITVIFRKFKHFRLDIFLCHSYRVYFLFGYLLFARAFSVHLECLYKVQSVRKKRD